MAGLVVVSTNLDLGHISFLQGLLGNALILGSTVGWAFENNLMAVATRWFDVATIGKFRNLLGGAAMLALALIARYSFSFSPYDMAVLALLVLALTGSTLLFIAAIKRLGAIRMLLVWSASTVFGALFALVFLGEQITPAQLVGGAMILLGVYIFRRGERPMFVP